MRTMVDSIAAVRRFNRFFTQHVGALNDRLLDSPFSLTEVRVLYELNYRADLTATELARDLSLDPGYLSRILARFEKGGFLERRPSPSDARQSLLTLTTAGREAFAPIDQRQSEDVARALDGLLPEQQRELVGAMATVERLLSGALSPCEIRTHRPGDIGWLVERHGAVYSQEWGYNHQFEALVAQICADFLAEHDPNRERCWIAERDGQRIGSVMLVRASDDVAKLRLLLVEPQARGLGLGRRLVEQCIDFARESGYKTLTLWTQAELVAAGRIYRAAGFKLAHEEAAPNFGRDDLIAQTWDLAL
jgi:DNA-binding MarR family transcriptional regulator/GNAT superfamily N-acetyltransferase